MAEYDNRRHALLVAILVAVVWCLFVTNRDASRPLCDPDPTTSSCNVSAVMRSDPYCAVDPTCISPWATPREANDGSPAHWQGFALLGDPLLISGNPIAMLALPNYLLYVAISCGLVVAAGATPRYRHTIAVAVGTWTVLELGRWLYSVWKLAVLMVDQVFVIQPISYFLIALGCAPFLVVAYWSRSDGMTRLSNR